ncbi:MAG: diguanylate cyclase [Alphaproteobacteria bacterium]|nr:diguanylate cyclase [Alphaproteobacteria bacterium]
MKNDSLSSKGRMRFLLSVLLPVLLSVVFTFALVSVLIYVSAEKSDEKAADREQTLVRHFLDQQQDVLRQYQANIVGWDDALVAVEAPYDAAWVEANLGVELHETAGIDMVFLLDPHLAPVFAMFEGEAIQTSNYKRYADAFGPFAERLREIDWQGALAAYTEGVSHVLPSIGDAMLLDGKPALVGFMPVASDSGRFTYRPGSEYIHIAVQFLDDELAGAVNDSLLVRGGHFDLPGNVVQPNEIRVPIADRYGATIAEFSWYPGQPGAGILADSLPAMIAGFAVTLGIVIALIYGLMRSTRQIEASRTAAQHMAFHDKLTGLANRALFEDRLNAAVAAARRGPNGIALLMIDLDRFKQVNDTLGHEAGDDLIRQVAVRMRPLLRETDTIARLGGDEFAVIQTDVRSISDVTVVAERVIRAIAAPFEVAQSQAFVGASIGIALAPSDALAGVELARKADIALYEAKSAGRNQYKLFEDRMSEAVRRRQTIEEELRHALSRSDGLDVDFVPLIRGDGTQIVGVTAEIVWNHSSLGRIGRDRFIPVAESCGLIEPLGDFVLQAACSFGAKRPGLRVGVRVYSAQLRNPLFFNKLFTMLDETGMQPENLELDIGEKMMSDKEPVAATTLRKLSGVGVNIALSDFGSGFRALALLQKYQVNRINIDRDFFDQLADCPDPEAITHAVVWLARAIGVEVSAEGVDSDEQKNFLHRMGVMSFQGEVFTPELQAKILRDALERVPELAHRKPPQDDIELWG